MPSEHPNCLCLRKPRIRFDFCVAIIPGPLGSVSKVLQDVSMGLSPKPYNPRTTLGAVRDWPPLVGS